MSKKVNRKIPKLRFSEFEESWDLKKLRSISSLSSGATPLRSNSSYFENATIPWVKTTDLNNSEILKTEECISDIAIRETSARKNPVGSVLIAMYGGFNQIGRTGLLKIEAATNQAITVVLPKSGIDSYFLLHFLNRNVDQWRSFAASSRKDPNITSKDVGDFPIAFPPIAEQEKIASFLGAVDTRISQLRRKHELLQTYKRGVMQKLFSQQIRFKGDDGQPFPDWKNKKLGEIASFFKGKGLSKENLDNAGKLKCIRYAELYTMYGEIINYVFSRTNLDPDDLILSKVNDVIIPSSGETAIDIAKAACVCIEGVVLGGDINILRSKIDGRFLAHYLNHYKKHEIASAAQGNTVVHLYNSHLKNIEIDIPTNKEQEKIAEFLIAIDQKIEAVAKQIELTEQFKKGLLQKMFV